MKKLLILLTLSSCLPAPIKVSSDNKKSCGKTINQEDFEAKVAIDTVNISKEKHEYYKSVYNQ
jgi:hypothetical protein